MTGPVFARVKIALIKHNDQSNLREERDYLAYLPHHQDKNPKRAVTWGQELTQRPWQSALYWLATHGFLSLLFITDAVIVLRLHYRIISTHLFVPRDSDEKILPETSPLSIALMFFSVPSLAKYFF